MWYIHVGLNDDPSMIMTWRHREVRAVDRLRFLQPYCRFATHTGLLLRTRLPLVGPPTFFGLACAFGACF